MGKMDFIDDLGDAPWVRAYKHEMDLTIAANLMKLHLDAQAGINAEERTLYHDTLTQRVAERVMPLDKELDLKFLGVFPIESWRPQDREKALAPLKGLPRGHWATFCLDGKYHAWMSDGFGRVACKTGHMFLWNSPDHPDLSDESLYSCVISMAVYLRRGSIDSEIIEWTCQNNQIERGTVITNKGYLSSDAWRKQEYLGAHKDLKLAPEADYPPFYPVVRKIFRGKRTRTVMADLKSFASDFNLMYIIPDQYSGALSAKERCATLYERRRAAAKQVYATSEISHLGLTRDPYFRVDNKCDLVVVNYWDKDHNRDLLYVSFESGADRVRSVQPAIQIDNVPSALGR
jgi:hypothetical protein